MNTLVVFFKAPVPGEVKSRLARSVGAWEAASLYKEMAREVYREAKGVGGVTLQAAYLPHADFPDLSWLEPGLPFFTQKGSDLGHRLTHAFETAFGRGAVKAAAIGSDSPGLPGDWIRRAFEALDDCDVALGPAEDGGYYLIALKEPRPELFANIPWSTPRALEETLRRAQDAGRRVHILPRWFDVDDAESLRRWKGGAAGGEAAP